MKETIIPAGPRPGIQIIPGGMSGALANISRNALFSRLQKLVKGQLVLNEGQNQTVFGNGGDGDEPRATLSVHDYRFYTDMAFGGSIGAAEAYMAGFWTTDDLTRLIRIIILNRHVLSGLEGGAARISGPLQRMLHFLRKNTKQGSRKNIEAHYDLGNDFYSLFLDDTMTYSCGIFTSPASSLRDASIEKYDRICRKLLLTPDDHILEIGTGWGGFALYAVKQYGCRVTTTTISNEQYAYAQQLIQKEKMGDRIELLLKDYRDLQGTYDKLVSIEMIEAVGHHYLETFFQCCSNKLKDDGMMLLQAIIIRDQEYDRHKHEIDFIKRYIFPGSCIPSVSAISQSVTKATDMCIFHLENITSHYVRTLTEWRDRFFSHIDDVRRQGYSDEFIRMWEYYLCYCEAGFAERYIGDVQILFTKPLSQRPSILPPLKGDDENCSGRS
jgi:cyclopropane-fatty-acyl-phospholipid synthase